MMNTETEWAATAKSQLIASSEQPTPGQGHLDFIMVLLTAIAVLACGNALSGGVYLPLVCVGSAILALILLISVRRLARQKSAVWEQLAHDWRSALESAEDSARQKESFLSWASREVRGPLTAISGCCDMLWEPAPKTLEEMRATIQRNVGQILAVADTLLDCSGKTTPNIFAAPIPSAISTTRFFGRVLVAEGGADSRKAIEFYLQRAGAKYVVVSDGQIAYNEAMAADKRRQPYNLILMDVQMPVIDGCTATILLRDNQYRAPIVAISSNATDRERCLAAGYNGFLTQPIDEQKFIEVLCRYLRPVGKSISSAIILDTLGEPDPGLILSTNHTDAPVLPEG
jgi:CheY-like chemotaxis protein